MSIVNKIEILKVVDSHPTHVREIVEKLRFRPKTVISLLKDMEEHGLLEKKIEKRNMRGRPRYMINPTILGKDYLKTYEALNLKTLRSRKNDLKKAVKDAEYVKRLEARNLSPFRLFLGLNSIVTTNNRNVK